MNEGDAPTKRMTRQSAERSFTEDNSSKRTILSLDEAFDVLSSGKAY